MARKPLRQVFDAVTMPPEPNVAALWLGPKFKNKIKMELGHVWAPGARETLQKAGGRNPPPFWRVSKAPGAAKTPKITDLRPLNKT